MEKTNKVNSKVAKLIKIAMKELERFFCIKIKLPKLIFYQTREQIDKYYGETTPTWLVGWAKKGVIHILAYEKFIEESSHKDREDFWRTLKHELAHLYYKNKIKSKYPRWLNEGLACYLAGQKKIIEDPLKFKNVKIYRGKNDPRIYTVGYLMVNKIVGSFGMDRLLSFLDCWAGKKKTQVNFESLFIDSFGVSPGKLWKKIIEEIKNQAV